MHWKWRVIKSCKCYVVIYMIYDYEMETKLDKQEECSTIINLTLALKTKCVFLENSFKRL